MKDIESREDIKQLVTTFYDRLQKEEKELDYLFNDVAKINWETHLPKMYDFWETLLFHKNVYDGNPMRTHTSLHQKSKLTKENFDKWLVLFKATVDDLFEGEIANLAKQRAESVALSIQLKTVYQK